MGMDVYGRNPKQNKPIEAFPTYHKYTMMEKSDEGDNIDGFKQKWKELDADEELRSQFWKQQEDYEDISGESESAPDMDIDLPPLPEPPEQLDMDSILDKINKSGMDSLTQEEKDFLYNLGG